MSDTIEVDLPDATPEVQEKTVEQRKADLIAERKARLLGEDDTETTEVEEVEVESPDSDTEVETPESETEEQTEEVLSQVDEIDIDSLTEEDILAIAKEKGIDLEPKENSAWAAQRRKIKELEAQLDAEKAAKQEALSIRSANTADNQLKQVEANVKYWNRKLILEDETQWDDAAGRDVKGVTHDGKFYTAEQVLAFVDQEEGKLPDLRKKAQEVEDARGKLGSLDEVIDGVRSKYDLDGEALDAYDKLLSDPKFEIVKELVPDFGVELVDLFGLAALQKSSPTKKRVIKRKAPKEKRESVSPTGSSSRPDSSSGGSSELKRLERIVSDPKTPISTRREAQLKIRHLKYS